MPSRRNLNYKPSLRVLSIVRVWSVIISANAPWLWKDGLGIADNVHVLLSVYAETNNLLSDHVEQLLDAAAGGFEVVSSTPGRQLTRWLDSLRLQGWHFPAQH